MVFESCGIDQFPPVRSTRAVFVLWCDARPAHISRHIRRHVAEPRQLPDSPAPVAPASTMARISNGQPSGSEHNAGDLRVVNLEAKGPAAPYIGEICRVLGKTGNGWHIVSVDGQEVRMQTKWLSKMGGGPPAPLPDDVDVDVDVEPYGTITKHLANYIKPGYPDPFPVYYVKWDDMPEGVKPPTIPYNIDDINDFARVAPPDLRRSKRLR